MANTYLTRSVSSTGNRRKWTWSGWLKRTRLGSSYIMSSNNGSNQYSMLQFDSTDGLRYYDYTSNYTAHLKTNRKFRCVFGWYHIVVTYDSAQATAADRIKFYVNGVQETSFNTSTYPSQDYDSFMNLSGVPHYIGRESGTSYLYGGLMSHVHYCDGYAYAPSDFGSIDNDTGEWNINTAPNVNYGTNGYFMFKDDNSLNDDSGNNNDFTLTGTLTKTQDNPSNIFCTLNPLHIPKSNIISSFDYGNTRGRGNSSNGWQRIWGNLGANSGKWWYEVYLIAQNSSGRLGWDSIDKINNGDDNYYSGLTIQATTGSIKGGIVGTNAYSPDSVQLPADSGGSASFTQGDYLGMGIDLDNNTITVYKNGSALATNWSYAGYNTSVKVGTYGTFVAPSANFHSTSGETNQYNFNFGNGCFGNTQLTGTTYTDSAGRGVFKYQPPANYLAFCTKNLNE